MKNYEGHIDPYQIFTVLGRPANVIEFLSAYPEARQVMHDWTNHARVLQAEPDFDRRIQYVKAVSDAYIFLFDRDPGAQMSFLFWRSGIFSNEIIDKYVIDAYLQTLP